MRSSFLSFLLVTLYVVASSPLALSGTVGGVSADAPCPPVDIYRQTMSDYVAQADCNMNMKVYSAKYVDALEQECDSLCQYMKARLKASKELQASLDRAHAAAKSYGSAMGSFAEDIAWFDFGSNESQWGTGYGYIICDFQAQLYWRLIVAYNLVLMTKDGYAFDMVSPLPWKNVGGVQPPDMVKILQNVTTKRSETVDEHFDRGTE